ncbi:putative Ig domain-containing protein [Cellulomonas sp. URHD0024]|uniref:RCC1 domain-containing protein n=1 Tax=Cellulomonas sp. URHD0024 TaxID=1302620 RepID=UPI000404442D|nr:putative Ig domain-containing protein [Cellulomonas sp. URHD0024]
MRAKLTWVLAVALLAIVGLVAPPPASAADTLIDPVTITPASGAVTGGTTLQIDAPAFGWKAIDSGGRHTLGLAQDGTVYAWGKNDLGQLGTGTNADTTLPVRVGLPAGLRFKAVAAGLSFSMALAEDGTVWSWGADESGQLGLGSIGPAVSSPQMIPQLTGVTQITAGDQFAVAGTVDDVFSWGANGAGQLGLGDRELRGAPTVVTAVRPYGPFDKIVAGSRHVIALSFPYLVYGWGDNSFGQLGTAVGAQESTATILFAGSPRGGYDDVFVAGDSTFIVTTPNVWALGRNDQGQLGLGTYTRSSVATSIPFTEGRLQPSQLVGSGSHIVALMTNGDLWTWGDNRSGQLGRPGIARSATPTAVLRNVPDAQVGAGTGTTTVVSGDGSASGWGANDAGQLGDGTTVSRTSPVAVRAPLQLAQVSLGGAVVQNLTQVSPTRFTGKAPSIGRTGTADLRLDTRTATGASGPAGVVPSAYTYTSTPPPDVTSTVVPPVTVGTPFSYTIPTISTTPVTFTLQLADDLPPGITFSSSTGTFSGTATAAGGGSGTVTATNANGSVTFATSVVTLVPPTLEAKSLAPAAAGRGYSDRIALTSGGTVDVSVHGGTLPDGLTVGVVQPETWSDSGYVEVRGTPTTPGTGSFALTVTGPGGSATRSFGYVVGVAPRISTPAPPSAAVGVPYGYTFLAAGSAPVTYGVASGSLPPGLALDATTGTLTGTPTATGRFDIVLATKNAYATETVDVVLRVNGTGLSAPTTPSVGVQEGGVNTTVSTPSPRFVELTTTGAGSLGMTADGYVWAWGTGARDVLSDRGTDVDPLVPSRVALSLPAGVKVAHLVPGSLTSFVGTDGAVWQVAADPATTSGVRSTKVAVPLPAGVTVRSAGAGTGHTLALATNGTVWAWGTNAKNQLGDGTTIDRAVPVAVPFPTGTSIVNVSAAGDTSLAVDSTGAVWSWGVDVTTLCEFWEECVRPQNSTPKRLATPAGFSAASVAAGPLAALAIARDGTLWSWGDDLYGETTHGAGVARVPIPLAAGETVRTASLAKEGGVATLSNGDVYRWGRRECGRGLGVEDCGRFDDGGVYEAPTRVPAPVDVDAVAGTACTQCGLALTTDGRVWAWGKNVNGQLGDGTTAWLESPTLSRAPFAVTGVTFDTSTAKLVGPAGNGKVNVLTPAHSPGVVDVVVSSTRPDGAPGPALRFSGAYTYGIAPTLTSGNPPAALTKVPYSFTVKATGTGPVTFSVSAGSLPAGLTLNAATGVISGTPTTVQTSAFSIQASNAFGSRSAAYSVAVTAGVSPKITSAAPKAALTKIAYSFPVTASGTGPITFSVAAGALPAGLTLSATTGVLAGTPTTAGTATFTLKVANPWGSSTVGYTMAVTAGTVPTITTTALTAPVVSVPYSFKLATTGTAPLTFSVAAGALPPGLTLSSSTGVISGTATTVGTTSVTIKAANPWGSYSRSLSLAVKSG